MKKTLIIGLISSICLFAGQNYKNNINMDFVKNFNKNNNLLKSSSGIVDIEKQKRVLERKQKNFNYDEEMKKQNKYREDNLNINNDLENNDKIKKAMENFNKKIEDFKTQENNRDLNKFNKFGNKVNTQGW